MAFDIGRVCLPLSALWPRFSGKPLQGKPICRPHRRIFTIPCLDATEAQLPSYGAVQQFSPMVWAPLAAIKADPYDAVNGKGPRWRYKSVFSLEWPLH
jgi:hypothetical protein